MSDRRYPHCAGCDERIWWGLRTVKLLREDFWLYFHRRCEVAFVSGDNNSLGALKR